MKKNFFLIIFMACTMALLTGCSSIAHRMSKKPLVCRGLYPGVRTDVEYLLPRRGGLHPEMDAPNSSFALMAIIDLPLSFVMDTISLPADMFRLEEPEVIKSKASVEPVPDETKTLIQPESESSDTKHKIQ